MAEPSPTVVWMPAGVRTEIHLRSTDTAGAMCMIVDHPPEGWSLPLHRHRREAETVHILAGHFLMTVDGHDHLLSPGETIHIPAGVSHEGRLLGGLGHRVIVFTPGGMERFFLETGTRHPSDTVDMRRALASATAHGWEFLTPNR